MSASKGSRTVQLSDLVWGTVGHREPVERKLYSVILNVCDFIPSITAVMKTPYAVLVSLTRNFIDQDVGGYGYVLTYMAIEPIDFEIKT